MTDTGRAGRVRVERRLVTARHGARLLDRKQHLLADELRELEVLAGRTEALWRQRSAEAERWLGRAAALDGHERIQAAAVATPATAEVEWGGSMGVVYPRSAHCDPPTRPPGAGSSALAFAAAAHVAALVAAVEHAAAQRAVLLVSTELTATRIRHRAVEKRWIPRLEDQLMAIRRRLDAQDLEEGLRLRWAADKSIHAEDF